MKKFNVTVHFRFVQNGEQEKDFDVLEIEATNLLDAFLCAKEQFKTKKYIPFQMECNGVIINPNTY